MSILGFQTVINFCWRTSRIRYGLFTRNTLSMSTQGDDSFGKTASETTVKTANKLRAKTPIGKLDELDAGKHPYQEKEPLKEWPDNTNPNTGEIGGPRGPEPTRYGDWERKGRVTDF